MLISAKRWIRSFLRLGGWDLIRYGADTSAHCRLARLLDFARINLVVDVGANTGQFGRLLRELRYSGRIVSFEPLTKAHSELQRVAAGDSFWTVAPRMALGDREQAAKINISKNSQSSSLLEMGSAHISASVESAFHASETVIVRTLDSVLSDYVCQDDRVLLKVDVQGYEDRVLRGAHDSLSRISGLQIELSLVPLYQGQALFDCMTHDLLDRGFTTWSIDPIFTDPRSGRVLQVDALFVSDKLLNPIGCLSNDPTYERCLS